MSSWEVVEGSVIRIDFRDGKPPHYWIVLNDPRIIERDFLMVSLTDRLNAKWNTDVWPLNFRLTTRLPLAKPSVIAVQFARIMTESELDGLGAELIGVADPEALVRARCNLHWFEDQLRPRQRTMFRWFGADWTRPCGTRPSA